MYSSKPLRVGLLSSSGDKPELIPLKEWFPILGTTINQEVRCYAHNMPEIRDFNFRISYRNIEYKNKIEEIQHPFIRECLLSDYPDIKSLNISCLSSLPSGLGMGSSGSFAVAFTELISKLERDKKFNSYNLLINAYKIEKKINQDIGFQDHIHAAFGGFNLYEIRFKTIDDVKLFLPEIRVTPLRLNNYALEKINCSFSLLYAPSDSNNLRENRLGYSVRDKKWSLEELQDKYNNIKKLINLLEANSINFKKIGEVISNDSLIKKMGTGYENIFNSISTLESQKLIYGGRPLGSKGSKFALIVSEKESLKKINNLGFKTIPIQIKV